MAIEYIEREYDKIANNAISLPVPGISKVNIPVKDFIASGPSYDFFENNTDSIPNDIQMEYEELLQLMNLDFPTPPKQEFDLCFYCNKDYQKEYEKVKSAWDEKFNEYETKLLQHYFGVEHGCAMAGFNASDVPNWDDNLEKAKKLAFERWEQKVELLKSKYGDDIFRYDAVVSNVFALERAEQLSGYSMSSSPPDLDF